jgi:hypothetical protein
VRAPALNPALRPSGYARRPSLYSRLSMPFRAYDAATDLIKRARNQLEMSSSLHLAKSPRLKPNVRGDMRRLSIVMAVAALDTYMHRLVVERAYEHDELPGVWRPSACVSISCSPWLISLRRGQGRSRITRVRELA